MNVNVKCWWCGERDADSAEHKHKASDLRRIMSDDRALLWLGGEGERRVVRGKGGVKRDRYKVLKYENSLCSYCNNDRSQAFDVAYDRFVRYVIESGLSEGGGELGFRNIFGQHWVEDALNVARYYAKSFGCRLNEAGFLVMDSIKEFMAGSKGMPDVRMNTVCNLEFKRLRSLRMQARGRLCGFGKQEKAAPTDVVVWNYFVGCFGIRMEWRADAVYPKKNVQFFEDVRPVIPNFYSEQDIIFGNTVTKS